MAEDFEELKGLPSECTTGPYAPVSPVPIKVGTVTVEMPPFLYANLSPKAYLAIATEGAIFNEDPPTDDKPTLSYDTEEEREVLSYLDGDAGVIFDTANLVGSTGIPGAIKKYVPENVREGPLARIRELAENVRKLVENVRNAYALYTPSPNRDGDPYAIPLSIDDTAAYAAIKDKFGEDEALGYLSLRKAAREAIRTSILRALRNWFCARYGLYQLYAYALARKSASPSGTIAVGPPPPNPAGEWGKQARELAELEPPTRPEPPADTPPQGTPQPGQGVPLPPQGEPGSQDGQGNGATPPWSPSGPQGGGAPAPEQPYPSPTDGTGGQQGPPRRVGGDPTAVIVLGALGLLLLASRR